ncbi:MAG: helix-hairpin-helix domain-containing protein, partial [Calditrichaeota bacterium]
RRLTVLTRLSFFDTDSFASRLFQYEHDVPGVVTNRALFGRGERWYLLLAWQPASYLRLTTKFAATIREDVDAIGSGPDRIEGHLDRRVRVQVDMQL